MSDPQCVNALINWESGTKSHDFILFDITLFLLYQNVLSVSHCLCPRIERYPKNKEVDIPHYAECKTYEQAKKGALAPKKHLYNLEAYYSL